MSIVVLGKSLVDLIWHTVADSPQAVAGGRPADVALGSSGQGPHDSPALRRAPGARRDRKDLGPTTSRGRLVRARSQLLPGSMTSRGMSGGWSKTGRRANSRSPSARPHPDTTFLGEITDPMSVSSGPDARLHVD